MKKLIPLLITLIVGIGIGWLVSGFGGSNGGHDHSKMASAEKAEIWTCSMHPAVKQPGPGKCPICAMDLIPLSKMGANAGARTVSLSENARKIARISTTEVVRKRPQVTVQLFGSLEHDQTRMKTLPARFPGRIERLFVDYDGARVQKGDHLAEIYSPDLLSAQSELLTAVKFGNTDGIEAARDKLELWGFSKARIQEIEQSKKTSDQLEIRSPISGVVTQKNVNEGDYVKTGDSMFSVADLTELWAVFHAYESDLPWLRFGQMATFTTEAMGEREFSGRISFIAPEVDPKTRTAEIRINLKNPNGILKPGMFIRGEVKAEVIGDGKVIDPAFAGKWISPMHPEIVKDEPGKCDICGMALVKAEDLGYAIAGAGDQDDPIVIPASAVLYTGKRSVVYVELPDQKTPHYRGRDVLIGPRAGDDYIILAGLNEGERVVTNGAFKLDSALQIQSDISMMNPADDPGLLFEKWNLPEIKPSANELFSSYLSIQKALVKSDLGAAKKAAGEFENRLKNLPTKENADWATLHAALSKSVTDANQTDSLEKFRAAFAPLTKNVGELVRRFEIKAYVMHCPMAFNNTGGTWLQQDAELVNPYFGDAMLYCGDVLEKLNIPETPDKKPEHKH